MFKRMAQYAVLALLAQPAIAEPGPRVTQLMNTPTSQFSFGLYRLQEHVADTFTLPAGKQYEAPLYGALAYSNWVYYDWDANRIVVALANYGQADSGWDHEEQCRQTVRYFRQSAFINPDTGEPSGTAESSYLASLFLPIGYGLERLPDDLAASLDEIIVLKVTTASMAGGGGINCEAALRGTSFSVQR